MPETMNRTDNAQYKGIDVLKFIMALFVVVAHTHPLYEINDVLNFLTADVIARTVVPFFFAATGFLLEKKIGSTNVSTKKVVGGYMRKILSLYCIWTIIYLPIIICDKILDSEESLIFCLFTVVRDFLFVGSYAHLWYLLAAAVGVAVVYGLKRCAGDRVTGIILIILFAAGLLTQSYFGLLRNFVDVGGVLWKIMKMVKKVMVTCRNGIFFGSIFIYMGTWIAKNKVSIKRWEAIGGAVVCVLLFSAEVGYLFKIGFVREQDMYVMSIPSAFFITMLAIQISVKGDTLWLRKMSMNIYYVHLIFKFIYTRYIGEQSENNIGLFVFVMIGALVTAYLMYRWEIIHGKKNFIRYGHRHL